MKRRILSVFMVLAMCVSLLPTVAFAAPPQLDPDGSSVAEVTRRDENTQVTEYVGEDGLAEILANPNTIKIKLLKDATISADTIEALHTTCVVDGYEYECIETEENSDVTLDLNGHKLRADGWVNVTGELTVLDSGKGGIFAPEGLRVVCSLDSSWAISTGILTLSGGTIDSDVLLDGGGMYVFSGKVAGTVSVRKHDCTILGSAARIGGRLTVTEGEIAALKIYAVNQQPPYDSTEEVLLSGGKFSSIVYDVSALDYYLPWDCTLISTLKQGTAFYDENDKLINTTRVRELEDVRVGAHECEFTNRECACGAWRGDEESGDAETAVAKVENSIGTEYVDTIEGVLGEYGTVTLLRDCILTTFESGGDSTLDLNGKTLKINHSQGFSIGGSLTVTDTSAEKNGKLLIGALEIERFGSLTLENGTIQVDKSAFENNGKQSECAVSGAMTVNGGTFLFGKDTKMLVDGAMTVNGGTVMGEGNNGILLGSSGQTGMSLRAEPEQDTTLAQDAGDTMRINGGTIKTGIEVSFGKTLTVTGGNFPAAENNAHRVGIYIESGMANISGGTIADFVVNENYGGKAELSGGTFDKVIYQHTDTSGRTVLNLLKDGYAFANKNDTTQFVQVSDDTSGPFGSTTVENVTVVVHEHEFSLVNFLYVCDCGASVRNLPITYIDAYGAEQMCTEYEEVDGSTSDLHGWHVVKESVTIDGDLSLNQNGNAHLILCDGATLTVNGNINGLHGSGLVIYAQSADASQYGKLVVSGSFGKDVLISLTVNGGEVKVDGGGAENGIYVENLTMNAGKLIAKNGEITSITNAVPISAIYVVEKLTVNGGEIEATGPSIGTAENPAGFGGTSEYFCSAITVGKNMTVNGGKVTAVGGTIYTNSNEYGVNAGIYLPIGANQGNGNPKLTVNQGTVTAKGGEINVGGDAISADIYSQSTGGEMTVNGGKVQQDTDGSAVQVMFDHLYAYGGTMKLAAGSEIGTIQTKSEASFGDLVADGCAYFKVDGDGNEAGQLGNSDIVYTGRVYSLGDFSYSILIRAPRTDENHPVPYLDENGEQKNCILYTVLEGAEGDKTISKSGWYVVRAAADNPTITGTLEIERNNEVHLILCDNTELTIEGGVEGAKGSSLHIYGQRAEGDENHEIGRMNVTGAIDVGYDINAGIYMDGLLELNSGEVTANAVSSTAGGGGTGVHTNYLTVNGGKLNAIGGKLEKDLTENDVTVFCNHGINVLEGMTVTGGEVNAVGGAVKAAENCKNCGNSGIDVIGDLTVTGGVVNARAEAVYADITDDGSDYMYWVYSRGIYATGGIGESNITVSGSGRINATAGAVTVIENANSQGGTFIGYSEGIFTEAVNLIVKKGGEVTATASIVNSVGNGISRGVFAYGGIINLQSGGKLTATGKDSAAKYRSESYGIYCDMITVADEGTAVKATSGKASLTSDESDAISYSYGMKFYRLVVTGGTVTAKCGEAIDIYDITGNVELFGGTIQSGENGAAVRVFAVGDGDDVLGVSGGTMKLAEDSWVNVYVSGDVTLQSLLNDGYAYQNADRTFVTLTNQTTLDDVIVKRYSGNEGESGSSGGSSGGGSSSATTFSVSTSNTENGELSVTPKNAKKGDIVTITVNPDNGYILETLKVLDKNGNEIPVTDNGDGTYSFEMPAGKVEIKSTFAENNTILNFFADVPTNAYFYDAALWAAQNGITGGIDENNFGPHLSCTRAQLVTFLWRAANKPIVNDAMNFTDVDADAYYGEAIRWAASLGIVSGYGNGLFGTGDTITREQMAVILYRFAQAMDMDTTQGGMAIREFADYESISGYALEAMQWAVNAGILHGDDNKLMPDQPCSRAQIVAMLYRLMGQK